VKDVVYINDDRTMKPKDKNGLISNNNSFGNFTMGSKDN
jgi:hypothetical protein